MEEFHESWDEHHWFRNFLRRHPQQLSFTAAQGIDMLRFNSDGLVSVEKFVLAAQHLMESYKFSPDLIINTDESPISTLHPIAPRSVGILGASKHNEIDPDDDSIRTIIPFAAADGTLWILIYIFANVDSDNNRNSKLVHVDFRDSRHRES
jgi:hypothetical protein